MIVKWETNMPRTPKTTPRQPRGWDALAAWYDGWMGENGSQHHQKLAIPAVLDLLDLTSADRLLDLGAGQGVLAPYAADVGARYTGVEISPHLTRIARQRHGAQGRFLQGDARHLESLPGLSPGSFDAAVFLLSIQDMQPLDAVLRSAAWALRSGGRLVILMTHPCFRVPRQSGWGHDPGRDLRFRRIDTYLKPLSVPMKAYGGEARSGTTLSFHRPLGDYINGLAACGLLVDALREISTYKEGKTRAEQRANAEIPLFAGIRARRV